MRDPGTVMYGGWGKGYRPSEPAALRNFAASWDLLGLGRDTRLIALPAIEGVYIAPGTHGIIKSIGCEGESAQDLMAAIQSCEMQSRCGKPAAIRTRPPPRYRPADALVSVRLCGGKGRAAPAVQVFSEWFVTGLGREEKHYCSDTCRMRADREGKKRHAVRGDIRCHGKNSWAMGIPI
jgi:hypothetical protein